MLSIWLLLLSPYNFHKLLKMKNKETKLPSMLWSRGCTQVQSFWNEAFLHLSKVQGFKWLCHFGRTQDHDVLYFTDEENMRHLKRPWLPTNLRSLQVIFHVSQLQSPNFNSAHGEPPLLSTDNNSWTARKSKLQQDLSLSWKKQTENGFHGYRFWHYQLQMFTTPRWQNSSNFKAVKDSFRANFN